MPKSFSEHERELVKKFMYKVGIELICKKGVKLVTVEDVTRGVNISKGSFYTFYPSKEEYLWDIVKMQEKELLNNIIKILKSDLTMKEKVQKIFFEEYFKENSLVFHLSQEDIYYITRKLPPGTVEVDRNSAFDINRSILELCGHDISQKSVETMTALTASLQFVCSTEILQNNEARDETTEILINAIVKFLIGGIDR